jgi:hypothetical protein
MKFEINKPTKSTATLTSELAGTIYDLIKTYGNISNAYLKKGNSDIDYENMVLVDKEVDRIVDELVSWKNGKLISPVEYGEDGEVVKEAVYFIYSTDKKLCEQVSSDLLDVEQVWSDVKDKFVSE